MCGRGSSPDLILYGQGKANVFRQQNKETKVANAFQKKRAADIKILEAYQRSSLNWDHFSGLNFTANDQEWLEQYSKQDFVDSFLNDLQADGIASIWFKNDKRKEINFDRQGAVIDNAINMATQLGIPESKLAIYKEQYNSLLL